MNFLPAAIYFPCMIFISYQFKTVVLVDTALWGTLTLVILGIYQTERTRK